jgi:SNF2 family DNA or RNA helicase
LVAPFLLRRTRKNVLEELPPREEVTRFVELSIDEAKRYAALRKACELEFTKRKKGETAAQTKIALLAALTRLRQLACDVSLVDPTWHAPSTKLTDLTDIVTELAGAGSRALVFSQFKQLLDRAVGYLERAGLRVAFLAGDTPTTKRREIVERFQNGEYDVFCISLMAGGTGLNLTHASYVIHLDPWWNPAVEEQATSRAHRIGQDQPVFVYKLVVEGSIEERMLELQTRKLALTDSVLGHDAAGALKFDQADLDALLAPLDAITAGSQTPQGAARRWGSSGTLR